MGGRAHRALIAAAALAVAPAAVAQMPAGRRVLVSETAVGNPAAPIYVVLEGGAVYRLEFEPFDGADNVRGSLVPCARALPCDSGAAASPGWITVEPRNLYEPPMLYRTPLDDDPAVGNRGATELLFPRVTGEYRIDLGAGPAVARVRILREQADSLQWACIGERDAGAPGPACAELRRVEREHRPVSLFARFGALLAGVALFLLTGH